jgi:hypothetical protein
MGWQTPFCLQFTPEQSDLSQIVAFHPDFFPSIPPVCILSEALASLPHQQSKKTFTLNLLL